MLDRFDRLRGHRAPAVLVAGAVAAAGSPVAPAHAGAADGPGAAEAPVLSITVTDERDEVAPGDETEYTLVLRNRGTAEAADLLVSQRFPDGAEPVDASAGAVSADGGLTWTVTVAPGEKIERAAKVRLGESGEDMRYVTATACAQTDPDASPVVCSIDADRLRKPAEEDGSVAEASAPAEPSASPSPTATAAAAAGTAGSGPTVPPAAVSVAGLGLLALGAVMLALDARWRRRTAARETL